MFALLVVLLGFCFSVTSAILTPKISDSGFELLKTGLHGSKLYSVNVKESTYDYAPYLLDLTSDPYESGFDSGSLLGNEFVENIDAIFAKALDADGKWWESAARDIMYRFLDKQYEILSEQLPEMYKQEFAGLSAGGESIGLKGFHKDVGKIAQRALVLGNFPSDADNLKLIIKDEKEREIAAGGKWDHLLEKEILKWIDKHGKKFKSFACSNFGVWGGRTENEDLFTGRNLDWMKESGITKYKLITIHHPSDGHAHATLGFAGLWGALTGMSAAGLTVHEANLESNDITFYGFPWILRLRHIMTYADDLQSGLAMWSDTNNTVGFNHGIGSLKDGKAVLMETMAHNTAVFGAMDPREVSSDTGAPRSDSIYRTNHGYDPYSIEHYMWNNTGAYKNSLWRYNLFPLILDNYKSENKIITPLEAVNITAIVGDKGQEQSFDCIAPYPNGENVLSATFHPEAMTTYIAWENGQGDTWVPAACNSYVKLDLTPFFFPSEE